MMGRTAALVVLLLLAVVACSTVEPAATGIGRDEAIRLAQRHVGPDAELVSATAGSSAGLGPEDEPPRPAWIVSFTGNFPMECPAPGPCPDVHNATVVIDAFDGDFISASYQ